MTERRAWFIFLSSSNYYLYLTLGIYKNLLDTNTKYPIYCGVTPDVNTKTRDILKAVGLNLIELDTKVISSQVLANSKSKNNAHYHQAFTKLTLFDNPVEKMFDKVVYIDTDVQVFENIDELFEYPHMSAIIDVYPWQDPTLTPYIEGCSKFCSGLFVWDFKNNPGKGHQIIQELPNLNPKITWHDQNILNYFYQDWKDKPELHIPPEYGIMNFKPNIDKLEKSIKAIHYTGRLKTGWPFLYEEIIPEKNWKYGNVHFKEWVTSMSQTVDYFNKTYHLSIPHLYAEHLILKTPDMIKQLYIGKANTYLSF